MTGHLGRVVAVDVDGLFSMAIFVTSESAAREGEH